MNLQLHCARPALSQNCKIFKGLQRDEKIAKFTSTYNKRERMATNKRRKAETCQKKQQRRQNGQIRKIPNHSLLQLPQTHRLHKYTACAACTSSPLACKRRCNAISAETVATETVKQQSHTRQVHSKKIFKQKRHGYRAFWCDFQKNCQADKNRVVTVCRVT